MRAISNTFFVLSLASLLLLLPCCVKPELIMVAIGSLALVFLLTLIMRIRSLALAGLAGYYLTYTQLSIRSAPVVPILFLSSCFCILAVCLAIFSDLPVIPKGDENR